MELEDRVAWVLNLKKDELKLNNTELGRLLDVNKNTAQAYTKGKGDLKGNALAGIVKHLKINGEWLISGKGEPFPGACEKFPEVCGPPGLSQEKIDKIDFTVKSEMRKAMELAAVITAAPSQIQSCPIPDFSVADDLLVAAKVLESKTHYALSLHMNIHSFAEGVKDSKNINSMSEKLDRLEERLNSLENENKNLHVEINKLKRNDGDCVPINLNPVEAAPTGTENKET